jgi:hypothetical protein
MNSSPITSWEGATAYFTFADNPVALGLIFVLSVVVIAGVIGGAIVHEKDSFEKVKSLD